MKKILLTLFLIVVVAFVFFNDSQQPPTEIEQVQVDQEFPIVVCAYDIPKETYTITVVFYDKLTHEDVLIKIFTGNIYPTRNEEFERIQAHCSNYKGIATTHHVISYEKNNLEQMVAQYIETQKVFFKESEYYYNITRTLIETGTLCVEERCVL